MKAIFQKRYGGPEVLEYRDVPTPSPKKNQVRVKVRAASVNSADYRLMRANPWLARLGSGWFKPTKWPILGSDAAGIVDAVGDGVSIFKEGDAVFGNSFADGRGSFAEYVCISEASLAPRPVSVSFEEAAAIPLAGMTALQGLRDLGQVEAGQQVLIQGAGGGVGNFALQIAKAKGAHVTAVCGSGSVELAEKASADRVINYSETDFTREDHTYDVIVGINGYHPISAYKRCLNPGGCYVMIGGDNKQIFEALLKAGLVFLGSGKKGKILNIDESKRTTDMKELSQLVIDGKLKPNIDRTFPLERAAEAISYAEGGHVKGKVVLTCD